jgi:single-strand DNA-binding protein
MVNKAILVGHLGADPELHKTPGGASVANFNIATTERWVDKQGSRQERVEWHRIVVWGKLAELCATFLRKGREAYIEGRIQSRQWQDKEGQTRYTVEVVASSVKFLSGTGPQQQDASGDDGEEFEPGMFG